MCWKFLVFTGIPQPLLSIMDFYPSSQMSGQLALLHLNYTLLGLFLCFLSVRALQIEIIRKEKWSARYFPFFLNYDSEILDKIQTGWNKIVLFFFKSSKSFCIQAICAAVSIKQAGVPGKRGLWMRTATWRPVTRTGTILFSRCWRVHWGEHPASCLQGHRTHSSHGV